MQRMTTDTPQTNMETLMNFAYGKDEEAEAALKRETP